MKKNPPEWIRWIRGRCRKEVKTIRYHLSGCSVPFQAEIGSFLLMNFPSGGVLPSRGLEIPNTNTPRAAGVAPCQ